MLALLPFYDTLEHWFKEMLYWLFDVLASLLEELPVPEFFNDASGAFSSIPPSVAFYLAPMELELGLSIILGAYVLRFVIRRIPIIG
ncbi:hypothetical protein H9C73_14025 [Marinobacterium sp. AK62]|uniref:DUF2523 domain-containing protein n=1 Tax=Marinobacterium alkalitolerans TaxID=1542925 RepID=A0ABS3ZE07_9GAMM|nr:DUF2523 family protein [Marinobacterium alkalitolerans]MBP0049846.1 hypothetical protein [Marinobacterium alkalitolerans]